MEQYEKKKQKKNYKKWLSKRPTFFNGRNELTVSKIIIHIYLKKKKKVSNGSLNLSIYLLNKSQHIYVVLLKKKRGGGRMSTINGFCINATFFWRTKCIYLLWRLEWGRKNGNCSFNQNISFFLPLWMPTEYEVFSFVYIAGNKNLFSVFFLRFKS